MSEPIKTPKGKNEEKFLQKEPAKLSEEELSKVSGGMRKEGMTISYDPTETSGCCGCM
jgi:bacteriocin-like protein